jgi:hypothetical protein
MRDVTPIGNDSYCYILSVKAVLDFRFQIRLVHFIKNRKNILLLKGTCIWWSDTGNLRGRLSTVDLLVLTTLDRLLLKLKTLFRKQATLTWSTLLRHPLQLEVPG